MAYLADTGSAIAALVNNRDALLNGAIVREGRAGVEDTDIAVPVRVKSIDWHRLNLRGSYGYGENDASNIDKGKTSVGEEPVSSIQSI